MLPERPLIALVDDDTAIIDLLHELLTDEGYRTICCLSADEAQAIIQRERPDMAIVDIRFQQTEAGWHVIEMVRRDPVTKDMAILVCSADTHFLIAQEQEIQRLNCAVLEKPFDLDTLLTKVTAALHIPLRSRS